MHPFAPERLMVLVRGGRKESQTLATDVDSSSGFVGTTSDN